MATQNRVNPLGELVLTDARGAWFGNRGVLHNARREIVRHHRGTRWIICLLQYKNRHHPLLQPGTYTGLYFLDEATALAAGHRPCAECRRAAFNAFREAWRAEAGSARPTAPQIDQVLQAERMTGENQKRTYRARLSTLPEGVLVLGDDPARPFLVTQRGLRPWSMTGYGAEVRIADRPVQVLTPYSSVAAIRHGYTPQIHISGGGTDGPTAPGASPAGG